LMQLKAGLVTYLVCFMMYPRYQLKARRSKVMVPQLGFFLEVLFLVPLLDEQEPGFPRQAGHSESLHSSPSLEN